MIFTRFAKVIFPQVSIHGGWGSPWQRAPWTETLQTGTPGQRPAGQRCPRQRPLGRDLLDRDPTGQRLPWTEPRPPPGQRPPVRKRAGGTHPTGMHSCMKVKMKLYVTSCFLSQNTFPHSKAIKGKKGQLLISNPKVWLHIFVHWLHCHWKLRVLRMMLLSLMRRKLVRRNVT